MDYTDYVSALQQMAVMQDVNGQALLNAILPRVIDFAELLMYRDPDLDFLATRTTDISQTTTYGVRSVPIPAQFIVVEGVTLVTPAGAVPTTLNAQRIPLLRTTRAFLDTTWPNESSVQAPAPFETYWALFSEEETAEGDDPLPGPSSFLIAPTPDNAYFVEVTGTFRPAPISADNPTTFLSLYLPDLFLSASMIFISGYQRNFSAQAEDPRMAVSWSMVYREQKQGAAVEEARKKALSVGGTAFAPTPLANERRVGGNPPAVMPPGAPR